MRPSRKGMPLRRAYPTAAGIALSGTGMTTSASAGCPSASVSPIRPRAAELRQRARKPLVPRGTALVRDDLRDHLGVARGRKADALARKLVAEIARVDAIAVVAYRELAQRVGADDHGLRVLDARAAGRRVARVADRRAAAEQAEVGLAEDLTDEAHTAHQSQVAAGGRREPRGFLAAVLERIEREENEPGGFRRIGGRRIPDADDATHLPVPRRSLLDGGGVLRPVVERLRADLLPERAVPAPGDRICRVDLLVAAGAGLLREGVGGAIEVFDDLLERGQAVVLDDTGVPVICARPALDAGDPCRLLHSRAHPPGDLPNPVDAVREDILRRPALVRDSYRGRAVAQRADRPHEPAALARYGFADFLRGHAPFVHQAVLPSARPRPSACARAREATGIPRTGTTSSRSPPTAPSVQTGTPCSRASVRTSGSRAGSITRTMPEGASPKSATRLSMPRIAGSVTFIPIPSRMAISARATPRPPASRSCAARIAPRSCASSTRR